MWLVEKNIEHRNATDQNKSVPQIESVTTKIGLFHLQTFVFFPDLLLKCLWFSALC